MSAPIAPTLPSSPLDSGDQSAVALHAYFQERLSVLASYYAGLVMAEGSGVDNHVQRVAYAISFQAQPIEVTRRQLSWAVVSDLTTTSTATDLQVLTRIAAVWNSLAGIG